jgi:streptogramin lyase
MKLELLLIVLVACQPVRAQTSGAEGKTPKPGVKADLKPAATVKVGKTADWVLVTGDAVWVASTKPYSVLRIDPATTKIVSKVSLSGEACSGLATGFGSLWVPLCGKKPSLVRVDADKNRVIATPLGPAGPEGGITVSGDSIWIVTDKKGTLSRIDPTTGAVRQKISIPPGSYNPLFSDGIIWVTGFDSSFLTAVDALTGEVLVSLPVGPVAGTTPSILYEGSIQRRHPIDLSLKSCQRLTSSVLPPQTASRLFQHFPYYASQDQTTPFAQK